MLNCRNSKPYCYYIFVSRSRSVSPPYTRRSRSRSPPPPPRRRSRSPPRRDRSRSPPRRDRSPRDRDRRGRHWEWIVYIAIIVLYCIRYCNSTFSSQISLFAQFEELISSSWKLWFSLHCAKSSRPVVANKSEPELFSRKLVVTNTMLISNRCLLTVGSVNFQRPYFKRAYMLFSFSRVL